MDVKVYKIVSSQRLHPPAIRHSYRPTDYIRNPSGGWGLPGQIKLRSVNFAFVFEYDAIQFNFVAAAGLRLELS